MTALTSRLVEVELARDVRAPVCDVESRKRRKHGRQQAQLRLRLKHV